MFPQLARPLPELRTQRLTLRALRSSDIEDVFAYASDPEVARHTLWEPHTKLADTRAFLEFVFDQNLSGAAFVWGIVHEAESRVIGSIALANYVAHHSRAELGFAIGRPWWNQGFTTEAERVVLSYGFRQLQLNRVEAYCKAENIASARVLEKGGLRFEGLLRKREFIKGEYEDLKLYAILRDEYFDRDRLS